MVLGMTDSVKFFDVLRDQEKPKLSDNTPAYMYNEFYRNGGILQKIPLSKNYNPYNKKIRVKSKGCLKGWSGMEEVRHQAQLQGNIKNLKRKEKVRLGVGAYPQRSKDDPQVK